MEDFSRIDESFDDIPFDTRSLRMVIGSKTNAFRNLYNLEVSPFFYNIVRETTTEQDEFPNGHVNEPHTIIMGDYQGVQSEVTFPSVMDMEQNQLFKILRYAGLIYQDERNFRLIEQEQFNLNDV